MSRLSEVLARTRAEGRAALVGYLPAGYPIGRGRDRRDGRDGRGGVDIVEVGLPYSDPLMDGPTIQEAVDVALRARHHHRPTSLGPCAASRRPAPRRW